MRRILAAVAAAVLAVVLAACSGGPARPHTATPKESHALTVLEQSVCQLHDAGQSPAKIFAEVYTAPESKAQIHQMVNYALANC